MNQNYLFKAGDRVSWCGMKGTVELSNGTTAFQVNVVWDSGFNNFFTADGRLYKQQTRPVLKLLKKKKLQSAIRQADDLSAKLDIAVEALESITSGHGPDISKDFINYAMEVNLTANAALEKIKPASQEKK